MMAVKYSFDLKCKSVHTYSYSLILRDFFFIEFYFLLDYLEKK